MLIDLTKLSRLTDASAPQSSTQYADEDDVLVLVKLHAGAECPSYVTPRAVIAADLFSAQVTGAVLRKLESDPSVQSVSPSRLLEIGH